MIVITIGKMNWNILVNNNKNKILVIENENIYNSKTIGYTKKKKIVTFKISTVRENTL